MRHSWTDEDIQKLARLCKTTQMSAERMGKHFGVSRQAIINVCRHWKLTLPLSGTTGGQQAQRMPNRIVNQKATRRKKVDAPLIGKRKKYHETVGGKFCQFPTGEFEDRGMNMECCGLRLPPGREGIRRSYCDFHVLVSEIGTEEALRMVRNGQTEIRAEQFLRCDEPAD